MDDVRWKQRFENFEKAYVHFRESVEDENYDHFSIREKQGVIQQFEVAVELGWKVLKDYLEDQGADEFAPTPNATIKAAFAAGILPDAELWLEMLNDRNIYAHAYAPDHFASIMIKSRALYIHCLRHLYDFFKDR